MGADESNIAKPDISKLRDTLLARGWNAATLSYLDAQGGTHDESSWALLMPAIPTFM
jgi:hypothetical protein